MLNQTLLAFASAALVVACVASDDDEVTEEDLSTVESQIVDPVPVEICPDLLNQYFQAPMSCTKDGQLGTKQCTRTCDIARSIRFTGPPPYSTSCGIDSSDCTPWACGTCVVAGPLGPLGAASPTEE
ncbi:MAG TPA: hypothetical protein VK427_09645 [Kofleriaceae bacterium]|nr:hypothetical protein [Kofleriaceae bacterium]